MALENVPGRLGKWLERYSINTVKYAQVGYLKKFFQAIYKADFIDFRGGRNEQIYNKQVIEINDYIEKYINDEERNFTQDVITMIKWMNTLKKPYSYRVVKIVYGGVKRFFSRQPENKIDHRYTIAEVDDEDIRKTLIPSRGEQMRDEKPSKAQLRLILEHLSIQHKANALFALSTGTRPEAIRRVRLEDMDLDADPPFAYLRQKIGGKSVAPQVWFSYETRDAIKAWLKVLPTIRKKTGEHYDIETPLNVSYHGRWRRALKKAGLDQKYKMARKTQHIYHFYTLRKFFYTQMKNDGMPVGMVDALMGHEGYLTEAYDRTGTEKLAELYLDHMDAVQIYIPDEIVQKELIIPDDEISVYLALQWSWQGSASKDRAIIEWKGRGRPKYPPKVNE